MKSAPSDQMDALENRVKRQKFEEDGAKMLQHARVKLIMGGRNSAANCFFATLALRLKLVVNWNIPTCAVDGKHLHYNPEFFAALKLEEAKGVICHEVMHCALAHPARQGARDHKLCNIAGDLAINPTLIQAGFTLPKGALIPGKDEYNHLPVGLTMEEYYARLQQPPQPQGGGGQGGGQGGKQPPQGKPENDQDPGGCGATMPPGDGSEADARESEADWEVAVAQAHQAAKQRGKLPAGLDRLVQELFEPKVDWKQVLREFINQHARNDYRWFPPNRRFIHSGLYLPGVRSEELGDVVLAVDTSGSISEDILNTFASEMQAILESYDCTATIVYCDAAIQHTQTWRSSDGPLRLEPKGGGGTSHVPVFDWIDQQPEPPTVVVCLTDLFTSFPDRVPDYPVMWCVVGGNNSEAPFGVTLQVE